MEYQHSRKAGNRGDVWKHAVLLAIADALRLGDEVLYIESHSGAPVHRLQSGGEWRHGVGKFAAAVSRDSDYLQAVKPWLDNAQYPASWLLVSNRLALRANKVRVEIADTSAEVAEALRGYSSPVRNVSISFSNSDGFDAARRTEAASLVFLDPPYTDKRDWTQLEATCRHLLGKRVPFVAWYPYSWHTRPDRLVNSVGVETWEAMWAKCGAKPSQNLKGCGMLLSPQVSDALKPGRPALLELAICMGWEFQERGSSS